MIYRFLFPLPPRALSPNRRPYSRKGGIGKAFKAKDYRAVCRRYAEIAISEGRLPSGCSEAELNIGFYCGHKVDAAGKQIPDKLFRPRDQDNAWASIKALIDGVVDAGVVVKDDHRHLKSGSLSIFRKAGEHHGLCGVEVILYVPGPSPASDSACDGMPSAEEMMRRARAFVVFEEGETPCGFGVYLSKRGPDSWAVLCGGAGGAILSRDGFWDYEPLPSSRDEAFLRDHRFSLQDAWTLARKYGAESPAEYGVRFETLRAATEAAK